MNEHIVKSFDELLEALSTRIAQMGGLAEAQLSAAVELITRRDSSLAERTIAQDQKVDELELDIEGQAVRLLALASPWPTTSGA